MLFCFVACKDDDAPPDMTTPIDYGYSIDINSPTESNHFSVGDTLPIAIDFSSSTGEIVHYISVDFYSKATPHIFLYSVQSHQHVPKFFEYTDNLILKDSSKIENTEEWILKAAMWSHEIDGDTISVKKNFEIKS